MKRRSRQPTIRPTYAPAAEIAAAIAPAVRQAVVHDHRHLAPAMAEALRAGDKVRNVKDRAGIARSLRGLLRWWGWIETLHLRRPEEQLLLASLLEFPELTAFGRVWAERIGRPVDQLVPVGDAPSWTARAEGLKRWIGGHAVNADPWRLFPAWIRDQLPVPPGDATPKQRRLEFLAALQSRCPTWVGVRGGDAKSVWNELREAELKPWIHRRLPEAAKLPPESDVSRIGSFEAGRLIIQDLSSQAVGIACDPDPGERWWDVRGEADGGSVALHLAALMGGKGAITCTFDSERRRHEAALRLRRGAYHNITTKVREGHHPVGKAASFDGVIVEALSSGVGTWRRHPDAALDHHGRADPPARGRAGSAAGCGQHACPARRDAGLHRVDPDPRRDQRRGQRVLAVASGLPIAALPPPAGRDDDRRDALDLAPPARRRWAVHRADDPDDVARRRVMKEAFDVFMLPWSGDPLVRPRDAGSAARLPARRSRRSTSPDIGRIAASESSASRTSFASPG